MPDELYDAPESMPSHAGGAGGAVKRSSTGLAFPCEVFNPDGSRTQIIVTRQAVNEDGTRTLYDHDGTAYRPRQHGLGVERIEET